MSTFNEWIFPLLFAYVQAIYNAIAFYPERGDRELINPSWWNDPVHKTTITNSGATMIRMLRESTEKRGSWLRTKWKHIYNQNTWRHSKTHWGSIWNDDWWSQRMVQYIEKCRQIEMIMIGCTK